MKVGWRGVIFNGGAVVIAALGLGVYVRRSERGESRKNKTRIHDGVLSLTWLYTRFTVVFQFPCKYIDILRLTDCAIADKCLNLDPCGTGPEFESLKVRRTLGGETEVSESLDWY